MKSLVENETIVEVKILSSHDTLCDERYCPEDKFKGFSGNKVLFSIEAVAEAGKYDKIILGHINLAPVGVLINKLYPRKHLMLITHGIEVWDKLSSIKKKLLDDIDEIITVSNYTRSRIIETQKINTGKIKILSNTIDPYYQLPVHYQKPDYLLQRYGIEKGNKIITTVCRLSSQEKYKGYDKVIETLPAVLKSFPDTRYIIVGKYDEQEKQRIQSLIKRLNLENNVILSGFIPDAELTDHYLLADLFVMPSKGEGFGIVFLEAMACGLPVITGNNDGSKEIIDNLKIGRAVDPDNINDLTLAITKTLNDENLNKKDIQLKVEEVYNFELFKKRVQNLIRHTEETIEA